MVVAGVASVVAGVTGEPIKLSSRGAGAGGGGGGGITAATSCGQEDAKAGAGEELDGRGCGGEAPWEEDGEWTTPPQQAGAPLTLRVGSTQRACNISAACVAPTCVPPVLGVAIPTAETAGVVRWPVAPFASARAAILIARRAWPAAAYVAGVAFAGGLCPPSFSRGGRKERFSIRLSIWSCVPRSDVIASFCATT